MQTLISAMLLVAAAIHLLPLWGLLGAARLEAMYGLALREPSLLILMQHRAMLFGMLGAALAFAAFHPPSQLLALGLGFVSVVSFLTIAWMVGDYNAAIQRVVRADLVALVCLLLAALARSVQ